jgi:hypothetical protein
MDVPNSTNFTRYPSPPAIVFIPNEIISDSEESAESEQVPDPYDLTAEAHSPTSQSPAFPKSQRLQSPMLVDAAEPAMSTHVPQATGATNPALPSGSALFDPTLPRDPTAVDSDSDAIHDPFDLPSSEGSVADPFDLPNTSDSDVADPCDLPRDDASTAADSDVGNPFDLGNAEQGMSQASASVEGEFILIHSSPANEKDATQAVPPSLPPIPSDLLPQILPLDGSVLDLIRTRPARRFKFDGGPASTPMLLPLEPDVVSNEELLEKCAALPIPTKPALQRCWTRWAEEGRPSFRSVQLRHGEKHRRLPTWFFSYWYLMHQEEANITFWYRLADNAENPSHPAYNRGISIIPWRSTPTFRTIDLAPYLSEEWLQTDHMIPLKNLANHLIANRRLRILDPFFGSRLHSDFLATKHNKKLTTRKWCDSIRGKLERGELDQVGVFFNIVAGGGFPQEEGDGDHWVAVVFDRFQEKIHYGDSLRPNKLPPPDLTSLLKWWIKLSFEKPWTIDTLPTIRQPNYWSCGEFAFTMMASWIAPTHFQPLGPCDLREYRVQLLERIVKLPEGDYIFRLR